MAWSASNAILIVCALSLATPLVTYIIAVQKGHVDPFLPYIASTGDNPPESTLFTQLVVVTAAFALLVIHIRFVHVSVWCNLYDLGYVMPRVNLVAVCLGYVTCAGLLVLACFQQRHAYYVHNIASIALFSAGCFIYIVLQSYLSWKLMDLTQTEDVTHARVVINGVIFACFVMYIVGIVVSNSICSRSGSSGHWCRNEPGWMYHIMGAVSEWMMLGLYIAYLLTFYNEFQTIKLTATRIEVIVHETDEPEAEETEVET